MKTVAVSTTCGCECVCHTDEDEEDWPGSCAGCCGFELGTYACRCTAWHQGWVTGRKSLLRSDKYRLENSIASLERAITHIRSELEWLETTESEDRP